MKKFFAFMMIAAAVAACDNPLEYKPENKDDELIVNALLDASETSHTVTVAVSNTEYVRNVNSATLRCFVNGVKVAEKSELSDHYSYYSQGSVDGKMFEFNASFKAGDLVRIEVDAEGKFHASNEQVVPEKPQINKIDTVMVESLDYSAKYMICTNITDVDGDAEDFYRLDMEYVMEEDIFKDEEYLGHETGLSECMMDTENDPVLSEGHIGNEDSIFELGENNYYGVFSDVLFNGGSVTLRPEVKIWTQTWSYPQTVEDFNKITVAYSLKLRLMHISKRNYYYLKAVNSLRDGSTDLALEDVSIPDNIDGGIGFIGISNSSTALFELGTASYDVSPDYYDGPYYEE